ncbi:TPA: GMP synthase, partial [Legionella pneumophila]|nr:GMP synthase [Legionella pneumophila]
MKIQLIQHAPFENPGAIVNWAIERGYQINSTHTYKEEKLPDLSEIDFLIIMGGPQSTMELDKYPYLRDEIALIRQAINSKKT